MQLTWAVLHRIKRVSKSKNYMYFFKERDYEMCSVYSFQFDRQVYGFKCFADCGLAWESK